MDKTKLVSVKKVLTLIAKRVREAFDSFYSTGNLKKKKRHHRYQLLCHAMEEMIHDLRDPDAPLRDRLTKEWYKKMNVRSYATYNYNLIKRNIPRKTLRAMRPTPLRALRPKDLRLRDKIRGERSDTK